MELPDWMRPPGSMNRQKEEDQKLSHGMVSSSARQKEEQLMRLSRKRDRDEYEETRGMTCEVPP